MNEIKRVVPAQNRLGETPIWDPEENALYWVDWGGFPTWRYDPATGQSTTFPVDLPVTSISSPGFGRLDRYRLEWDIWLGAEDKPIQPDSWAGKTGQIGDLLQ